MEWAERGALSTLLRARDPALSPIEKWAVSLARALARVHAAGWVHHDVKPANVLIRTELVPLLSDFGTARRLGEPSPPGSAGYLSPERIAQRSSDPRDDVFGFGRLLEEALAALPAAAGSARDAPKDSTERWRAVAAACTGPDCGRPRDGTELLAACTGDSDG
jgi:serine/threonine-protein kinase